MFQKDYLTLGDADPDQRFKAYLNCISLDLTGMIISLALQQFNDRFQLLMHYCS